MNSITLERGKHGAAMHTKFRIGSDADFQEPPPLKVLLDNRELIVEPLIAHDLASVEMVP